MMRRHIRALRDRTPLGELVTALFSVLRQLGMPVPEAIYKHLPYRGELKLLLPNGRSMLMRARGEILENGLYWQGIDGYEPEWLSVWCALAQHARGVVDIGANTGLYSLMAAAMNPSAHVYAFEPVSRIADRLQENVSLNKFANVTIHRCAVGEKSGEAQLFDPGGDTPYSASIEKSFLPDRDPTYTHAQGVIYQVPVRTVDDVFSSENNAIDLVKVDAEGAEIQVLHGAAHTLARCRPSLLLEYLSGGTALDNLVGSIMRQGYRLFHSNISGLREIFAPQPAPGSWNVLLHPREKELPQGIQINLQS